MTSLPQLNAWVMRSLAEGAHGTRGELLTLVVRNGQYMLVSTPEGGDVCIAEVRTPSHSSTTKAPGGFRVVVHGTAFPPGVGVVHGDITNALDAFFWTESSIEKFFFPYYAGVLRQDEFDMLRASYYRPVGGKAIFAFGHEPGTRWVPATTGVLSYGAVVMYLDEERNVIEAQSLGDWLAFLASQ